MVYFIILMFCLVHGESQMDNIDPNNMDVPLISNLEAPLKATLDISQLNKQLTALIDRKVKEGVEKAMENLIETKVENHLQLTRENLKSWNNQTLTAMLNSQRVGFTAFGTAAGTLSSGTIIKFPSIASSFGLTGLSSFRSTGVFRAEKDGVYLIITSIMVSASRDDTFFNIYKNNQPVHSNNMYYAGASNTAQHSSLTSGTGSLVLQLSVGDTVDVRTENNMYVLQYASSLTVIKIN